MRIWILSDLHVEVEPFHPERPTPRPDLVIAAGDISTPLSNAIQWLRETMAGLPTILVPGNHEYYSVDLPIERNLGRRLADEAGIRLLDDDVHVVEGVRFVGSTLWTDFDLDGDRDRSMQAAQFGLADFRRIRHGTQHLTPEHVRQMHLRSRAWLRATLEQPFDGRTVVITHHAPLPRSLDPRFTGDALNPAFASDLAELVERTCPHLWIHGHTHSSHDYVFGETRIVCNPRGYAFRGRIENPAFDPGLVVDIR